MDNLKYIISILLAFIYNVIGLTQSYTWNTKFIDHLLTHNLNYDLIDYLDNIDATRIINFDSVYYLKGLAYQNIGKQDISLFYFNKIEHSDYLHDLGMVFIYKTYIEDKNVSKAKESLKAISSEEFIDFKEYNLNSVFLLSRDFRSYSYPENQNDFYKTKNLTLNENYEFLLKVDKKSPVIAGSLSAIVPGLGKIYAGKPKQGLSTFFTNLSMAVLAYEGYKNESVTFYIFGGLFGFFYIGNIFGSAASVKISYNERCAVVDEDIYNDISLSIRYLLSE